MCGIVGYIGNDPAVPILLEGLERLEYRGYDSAGVFVYNGQSLTTIKTKVKLVCLNRAIALHRIFLRC